MRTIYLDAQFRCHIADDGTMTAVETDFFDGKCDTFIEGYRYVPEGESWTAPNGTVFEGELIAPFKDRQLLETAQALYEETIVEKERVDALEEENAMLTACILEMSEIVYA